MSSVSRKLVRFSNFFGRGPVRGLKISLGPFIQVGPFFNIFRPGPRRSRLSKIAPVVVRILDYKIGN